MPKVPDHGMTHRGLSLKSAMHEGAPSAPARARKLEFGGLELGEAGMHQRAIR